MPVKLGTRVISKDKPPFVIAEMSGNHGGSLSTALSLVDAVAASGAQALKLQTYTADTMTLDVDRPEFMIRDSESLWRGRRLHELYEEAHTPWEWHEPIMQHAQEQGLVCFSSAFDASSVDFLESLDVPMYKVASFECIDLPLIRKIAATGKPMIISTGMATLEEIEKAVKAAREAGCEDLTLLKCTSSYPARPEDANLLTIPAMRERFECEVGLSDHTIGTAVAVAAVALGATAIEKHVTLSRKGCGVDAAFSAEPHELAALVRDTASARVALGEVLFGPTDSEKTGRTMRRSLYFTTSIPAGDRVSAASIRSIRPGLGLLPEHFEAVIGRTLVVDVEFGQPVSWDCFEKIAEEDEAGIK
jgi:pseudaminic acid synthase